MRRPASDTVTSSSKAPDTASVEEGLRLADALQTFLDEEDWERTQLSGKIDPDSGCGWRKLKQRLLPGGDLYATGNVEGSNFVEIQPRLWEALEPKCQWLINPETVKLWGFYDHRTSRKAFFPKGFPVRRLGEPIHDADLESVFWNPHTATKITCVRFHRKAPRKASRARDTVEAQDEHMRYRTGASGRPGSSHLVVDEFRRRVSIGEMEETVAEQARVLIAWLNKKHPLAAPIKTKTAETAIRHEFRRARKSADDR